MTGIVLTVIDHEFEDQSILPAIVDKHGSVGWESGDTHCSSLVATKLKLQVGSGRSRAFDDIKATAYLTDARLVIVCKKFNKGGGWVGTGGAMIVFNTASKIRAKIKSHGKFLVGQVRWPWVVEVAFSEKKGWAGSHKVRVTVVAESNGQRERYALEMTIPKQLDPEAVARQIHERVVADRLGVDGLRASDRSSLEASTLGPAVPGEFVVAQLDGALVLKPATAYRGRYSSQSSSNIVLEPPQPLEPLEPIEQLDLRPGTAYDGPYIGRSATNSWSARAQGVDV